MSDQILKPRRFEFRARDVAELIGVPLSPDQIFTASGKQKTEGYHNKYNPEDVRAVRRKINPAFDAWCESGHLDAEGLPKIIATHISKGGTGKTSITANVAIALVKLGYRGLLIDGDPQFSLTTVMGVDADDERIKSLRDTMFRGVPIEDVVLQVYEEDNARLDFIPSDLFLNHAESDLLVGVNREKRLRAFILENKAFFAKYDFVFMDTNPAVTSLNYNILYASSLVLVPMFSDGLSAKAIRSLSSTLQDLHEAKPDLPRQVMVVLNNHNPVLKHTKDLMPTIESEYGGILAETKIPAYVGFSRQVKVGRDANEAGPLLEIEPTALASKAIVQLAREIEALIVPPAIIGDGGRA